MTEHIFANSPREIEHLDVPPPLPRYFPYNLPVFDCSHLSIDPASFPSSLPANLPVFDCSYLNNVPTFFISSMYLNDNMPEYTFPIEIEHQADPIPLPSDIEVSYLSVYNNLTEHISKRDNVPREIEHLNVPPPLPRQ